MENQSFDDSLRVLSDLKETFNMAAYKTLPQDWWVVVTDIKGSTKAIEAGRYRDINAVGGSTIAAIVNALKPIKIPYVFGGDGATFCIPPNALVAAKEALKGCQELAKEAMQLELRVGIVPLNKVTRPVKICKYKVSPSLIQYFFMGGGLEDADRLIKESNTYALEENIKANADFSGFECRWNEIPSQHGVTMSLLVKSRADTDEQTILLYQMVSQKIVEFLGDVTQHHPLNRQGLSLSLNKDKLNIEVNAKSLHQSFWAKWKIRQIIRAQNIIGKVWMAFKVKNKFGDWGQYKQDMVVNSDYIKLDDTFRAILSGEKQKVQAFIEWLNQACKNGDLFYGVHLTNAALITCLVAKTGTEHIHFVDANNGGYTMAAKQLKNQMILAH